MVSTPLKSSEVSLNRPHTLPYNPLRLTGMDLALQRLYQTVVQGEKVGIFGDFDVDGITGTAIMAEGLEGQCVGWFNETSAPFRARKRPWSSC